MNDLLIRISSLLILMFLFSCREKDPPAVSTHTDPLATLKDGDTIYKSCDTVIIKNRDLLDTLVKYKPVNDSSYLLKPEHIHFTKRIDLSHYEFKKKFITRITEGVKEQGVNFAGHYCFVYWGCGSPCKLSAMVDLRTGNVYNGLDGALGYGFKKNSCLLIVNAPDSTNWYNITVDYAIPQEYIWTGKNFKRYSPDPAMKH